MARLVLKSPYLKPNSKRNPGNYLEYIATREGVEMAEDTSRHLPATTEQQKEIARVLKQHPDSKDSLEYEDYLAKPTRGNADAFLGAVYELYNDAPRRDVYLKYISERPGAVNGLFTDEGVPIVLAQVQKEMNESRSNIWTHVISLHREDAERLGYNTPETWMHLLRSQRNNIARQMRIDPENFRWYAAFHNAGHHPHVHLMAYSVKPNEAYLSKQGIENIKSSLAKEIFQQDLLQIYQKQTDVRDELRQEGREKIQQIVEEINQGQYQNPEMEILLLQLSKRLEQHKGKKQYGYLNTGSKKIADTIVSQLASDPRIQELYKLWYEQKEDVLRTYTNAFPERVPLEQNTEFKTIRNAVVQAALDLTPQQLHPAENTHDQAGESPQIFDTSAARFAEEATEESPPSAPSSPRVGFSNWWSKEYKLARQKQSGTATSPPVPAEAYRLMLAEAENCNGLAMHDVGRMLLIGTGCNKNEEAAQEWFRKAYDAFLTMEQISQNPSYWQYRLGKMCALGYGVEKNHIEAVQWYEKAVEWNNPFAAYALGSLYHYGEGVEQNVDRAIELYTLAATHPAKPNAYAQYQLGRLSEDAETADKWYRLAYQGFRRIEQDFPDDKLYHRLGSMLLQGLGTNKDLDKAHAYLRKAILMGNTDAIYSMGKLYLETDIPRAISMFELSAEQGNYFAEYQLGKIYCYGNGVPQNTELGIQWLQASADHGSEYAASLLQHIQEHRQAHTTSAAIGLIGSLAKLLQENSEQLFQNRQNIDRKLRRQIEEKKQAQGLKSDGYSGMQM